MADFNCHVTFIQEIKSTAIIMHLMLGKTNFSLNKFFFAISWYALNLIFGITVEH